MRKLPMAFSGEKTWDLPLPPRAYNQRKFRRLHSWPSSDTKVYAAHRANEQNSAKPFHLLSAKLTLCRSISEVWSRGPRFLLGTWAHRWLGLKSKKPECNQQRRIFLDSCCLLIPASAMKQLRPRTNKLHFVKASVLRTTQGFMPDADGVYRASMSSACKVVIKQTGVWYNYSQLLLYNWMP